MRAEEYRWRCTRCGGYVVRTSGSRERECGCSGKCGITFAPDWDGILFTWEEEEDNGRQSSIDKDDIAYKGIGVS